MGFSVTPTGITADRNRRLMIVTWDDMHTSEYPFALLRFGCPCASCRGGHEKMNPDPDPEIFERPHEDSPATRMRSLEPVGAYAVTIEWEDGHHYGIYNWDYLRRMCPCPVCRS